MNRRMIKVISFILTVTLILDVFAIPTTTAFASNENADGKVIIKYEGEAPNLTPSEPSDQPEPSEQPQETTDPSSDSPEPTTEPPMAETPAVAETPSEVTVQNLTLDSLLDENGFLSDEAFDILQPLPCEEEKYTEVTDLGDGKFGMKIFTDPIKFENEDGEYELIDNSIVAVDPKDDSKHEYKNAASDVEVLMSDNIGEDSAIEINHQGYSIGFKPLNVISEENRTDNGLNFIEKDKAEKQEAKEDKKNNKVDKKDKVNNIKDDKYKGKTEEIRDEVLDETKDYESVEYTETFNENTDIQITPMSSGVKEDIILYEIPRETEFSYEFTVDKVTPVLRQDGNMYFIDLENGYIVGAIPSPFMYDSKKEFSESYDIKVTLEQVGVNKYKYTLIPNRDFLEDENTVYPVIIDPSWLNGNSGCIQDTFTTSRYSGNNYANDANIKVGYSSDLYKSRGLAKISNWPISRTGYYITRGAYVAYQNYDGSSSPTIEIAQITSGNWDVNTVNWSNQPSGYTVVSQQTVSSMQWYLWDITDLVRGWYLGSINNFGIYVKSSNEGSNMYKRFYSANDATVGDYFYIEYFDCDAPHKPIAWTSPDATNSWTKSTDLVLNWKIDYDIGSGMNRIEYNIDGGAWSNAGVITNNGTQFQGSTTINGVVAGIHTIRVHGVDNGGNVGPDATIEYKMDNTVDGVPAPSVNFNNCTANDNKPNCKDTISIPVTINSATDYLSGINYYRIIENGIDLGSNYQVGTIALPNRKDFTQYTYKIVAYDKATNSKESVALTINTPDRTEPVINAASNVQITPSDWTSSTSPTISWGVISDEGGGTTKVKYEVLDGGTILKTGEWTYTANVTKTIDLGNLNLPDKEYDIKLTAYDAQGNYSDPYVLKYKKDTVFENAGIILPENENVVPISGDTTYDVSAFASDSHLNYWKLDYALGTSPVESDYTGNEIDSDYSNAALNSTDKKIWDLSGLNLNRFYTLRLTAADKAGNIKVVKYKVLYALDTDKVAPKVTLKVVDTETSESININDGIQTNQVGVNLEDTTVPDIVTNNLYANDTIIGSGPYNVPLTFNPLKYDVVNDRWMYPEGSQVFLRMMSEDINGDYYFTNTTYQGHKIVDVFDNIDNLTNQLSAQNNTILNGDKIELTQTDSVFAESGSIISKEQEINGLINYVTLTVDQETPTVDEIEPNDTSIKYYFVYDGGEEEILPNQKTVLNIPTNNCSLKAVLTTTNTSVSPSIKSWNLDVMFVSFGDSIIVNNSFFDNARGFCNLVDVVHDGANDGSIKLDGYSSYPNYIYRESGHFESTVRNTPGDVYEAFLSVEEDKPDGTNITYEISTDGGSSWQPITPGTDQSADEQWLAFDNEHKGNMIKLRATLTSDTNHTETPQVLFWSLKCRQTLAGNAYDIKLIDEPDNLSTLVDANYTTLLRWEPSETEGVSYKIYRSETPYFDLSNMIPLDTTTNCFYSDYNLQFETKFYYKVTAVKDMMGSDSNIHERESLPSNEAWAHTVSEDALNEKLGLQDYWTYSGFESGGGTGYVNVANGNLVYKNTDMVISDPFLASVMSRTYNSLADTKTPMGYGWDYSFNTCLLKVKDSNHPDVDDLVLKDGDGTFHKFDYNPETGEYASAKGTFMKLTEVENALEEIIGYEIKRKDDITYYFDADTMKLKKFTNNNGIELTFRYDFDIDESESGLPDSKDRGNLKEIVNSVGEKIKLDYYVDGSTPEQGDYIYVNSNVDMLASVTWESTESSDSITYNYVYYNDKLESVKATINGDTTQVQTFYYDVDVDNNVSTTEHNIVITDAENRITVIETNYSGEVSKVYDPITLPEEEPEQTETQPEDEPVEGGPIIGGITPPGPVGSTDPSYYGLSEYYGDCYDFSIADTNSDNLDDRTTVTNSRGVSIEYNYDINGLLESKTDAMDHSIWYGHNDDYLVTSVMYNNTIEGAEKTIKNKYGYTDYGNIESITSYWKNAAADDIDPNYTALGPQTQFTYRTDLPNKVDEMIVTQDTSKTAVTKYTYDGNGNIKTTTVAYGTMLAQTTTYDYYDANDPDDPNDPIDTCGLKWQLKSVEDEYGNETRYLYDTKGRLQKQLQYDADDNYVRTVAAYIYDGFGRTDKVTQPFVSGDVSGQLFTDMDYDDLGRLEQKINPDGTYEKWDYDLTGRLETDTIGYIQNTEFIDENITTYGYDLLGRQTSVMMENDPTVDTDDATSSVSYGYWDSTSLIGGVDADKITQTDARGTKTIEYYDILGRLDHTTISNGTTEIVTAQYTYDEIGNVKKAVDSAGTVTLAEYNELNQQVRTVVDPFDSSDGKDNMNIEKLFTYDYLGNAKTVTEKIYKSEAEQTDPQMITTWNDYDIMSRLEKVTQVNPDYDPEDLINHPQYLETSYEYDKETILDGESYIKNYTQDALGYISETYFDELGRTMVSFNRGSISDGDDEVGEFQKTTYSYLNTETGDNKDNNDAFMLAETITRTDGTKEVYKYDDTGRVKKITYINSEDEPVESVEYKYDEMGRVQTESSTTGQVTHNTSYIYDRQGRTKSVWEGTCDNNGAPVKEMDGLDIEYTYNKVGQVNVINYNTGSGSEHNLVYNYDLYGRINEIRLQILDDIQTPEDESRDYVVRKYFYNETTGVLEDTRDYREFADVLSGLGDYILTHYEYNSAGLVYEIKYTDADFIDANNGTGLTEKHTITYDGKGQILQEQQDTDYSKDAAVATKTIYKGYEYDSLGRLKNAGTGDNVAATWTAWDSHNTYTYDLDGNRKTMDNGTDIMSYDYNQFNQLGDVFKNGVLYQKHDYDLRGNQLHEITKDYLSVTVDEVTTKYDQVTTYDFNLRDQMTGTTIATPVANETTGEVTTSSEASTYLYNAGGQRMKKYEPDDNNFAGDDITKYFYTGSAVLYTTSTYNNLMTENIIDPNGQIIASKRFDDDFNSNTPYELAEKYVFFHYDIRGSVTNIVRPDGTLLEGNTYDEFGNMQTIEYGTDGNPTTNEKFKNEVTFTGSISDMSTGLQYMNARYYDPKTGRFLSQDTYSGNAYEPWTQHLYSYCGNNPTNFIDPTGHSRKTVHQAEMKKKKEKEDKKKEKVDTGVIVGTKTTGLKPNDWNNVSDHTWRWADSDGNADYDIDIDGQDDHGVGFPHQHDWKGKQRGDAKVPDRPLPPVVPKPNEEEEAPDPIVEKSVWGYVGAGLGILVGGVGIAVIAADDVTGVGIADDGLIPVLGAALAKCVEYIFA